MTVTDSILIHPASTPEDLITIRALFSAYAASLPIDISYQNFTHELSSLPGKYDPTSGGILLLARSSSPSPSPSSSNNSPPALGCVALRALDAPSCCEMKRLYVTEPGRGQGIGKRLLRTAVQAARDLGYREIRLDTLPSMHAAIGMYREVGFREIEAYYDTPVVGTIFLGLVLD
jgi:ribosomal protein S18 acetylase RimI-like enzyme